MKIKIIKSYKWDNYKTFVDYRIGMIAIGIIGLLIYILVNKNEFKKHSKVIMAMGFDEDLSIMPFDSL